MEMDMDSMFAAMSANFEERIAAADARRREIEAGYAALAVDPKDFGERRGPVHAASILAWTRIAEMAGVPHVPATAIASVPTEDAWYSIDQTELVSEAGGTAIRTARKAIEDGEIMWRTDLCASSDIKQAMARGDPLPAHTPLHFDDPRIVDMHYGLPTIDIIARPRVTPMMHAGYPVEFRVFIGGAAEDVACSWYYPQAGVFETTPEIEEAMERSIAHARTLHDKRRDLGLVPWLPETGEPDEGIGSTIDFMLTTDGDVVMIDAGPGFGHGAHPCCFIDQPVKGRAWHLAEGVEER